MNYEDLLQFNPRLWPIAIMGFLRIATIVMMLPFFGDQNVPARLKILLSLTLTICLWPLIEEHARADNQLQWSALTLMMATVKEVIFGFTVSFAAKMVTYATQIASQITGTNMGFQVASMFNPAMGQEESVFSTLHGWIVLMLFVTLNGHLLIIKGIAESFKTVPIGAHVQAAALWPFVVNFIQSTCLLAIKVAAPLLCVQFIATISMGLLNRAIPQFNMFVVSFPVSFLLSMGVFFLGCGVILRMIGTQIIEGDVLRFFSVQHYFR